MRLLSFSPAVIALLSQLVPASAQYTTGPTATIANGVLHGTTTVLPSATAAVNKYLGIPFAQSPLRFEPPTAAQSWSTPLQVTNFTAACVQQFNYPDVVRQITMTVFNNPLGAPPAESEDCLYLNVYAPSTAPPPDGRAVMFWIFGGSFEFGTAMQQGYDGSSFAYNQDVIVVVPNYRTNGFGFSSAPQLPLQSRNAGFLDQRMALQWVQSNIAAFGGDASKVTIFGESAGAASVDRLVTTMGQNPPFRAGIMESGQATFGTLAADGSAIGLNAWNTLISKLNCGTNDSSSQAAYLCAQQAPATTLKSIIEQNSLAFNPVADNLTQFANPQAAYAAGRTSKVPLLVGTNAQEGTIFMLGQSNLTAYLQTTFANLAQRAAIASAFPASDPNNASSTIASIFTQLIFACPQSAQARVAQQAGHPVYRYYYDAQFANIQPLSFLNISLGIYHSSEIGLVYGTYPTAGATAQQVALSSYMQGAWADFAKNPVSGPGWNALGTFNGTDMAVLGANGTSGVTIRSQALADQNCGVFNIM